MIAYRHERIGIPMVDSIRIRNFRSFSEARIEKCCRINVVVGDNGSGKTALLEALFLSLGVSPELILRTRTWRGVEAKVSGTKEDINRALWADLFYKFQTNKSAVISLKGEREQSRSVTVTLNPRGSRKLIPPSRKTPGAPIRTVSRPPIEFKWEIQGYPDVSVEPTFDKDGLVFPPIADYYVKAAFFAANRTPASIEVANRFSMLSRTFQAKEFIEKFHHLYSSIKNLSIELSASAPMLFAEVEGLPEQIPLSLASGGMSKLAGILLAMAEQAGGVVIVDEIENGFFHDRLPAVWASILEFSRLYNCQVFASTHSVECLRAVAPLVEKSPEEFCLMRTVLRENGTAIRRFEGEKFAHAVLDEVEVR
jgi:hypothetical protein